MPLFGILKSLTINTGLDNELSAVFASPLAVRSNQPIFAGDTISLRRKTSTQSAQRWEIDANLVPTNNSNNFLIHSVRYGYHGVFGIRMPQTPKVLLSPGQAAIAVDAVPGSATIELDWTISGSLVPGEFINIGVDPKVYIVLGLVDNNPDIVEIFPPLQQLASVGALIKHGYEVTMQSKFDTGSAIGMVFVDGILMDPGSIKIIEAINAIGGTP